jgi:hypothetical protein
MAASSLTAMTDESCFQYVEKRDVLNWLTPEEGPLKGFEWSPGSKRHTTGIHMWSEIFLANLPSGDEVETFRFSTST